MHLLKMTQQPEKMTNSWRVTIVRERDTLEQTLADNPGLRPRLQELFDQAYPSARREATAETDLPAQSLSKVPEFNLKQV